MVDAKDLNDAFVRNIKLIQIEVIGPRRCLLRHGPAGVGHGVMRGGCPFGSPCTAPSVPTGSASADEREGLARGQRVEGRAERGDGREARSAAYPQPDHRL